MLQALRELEFEHQAGYISASDFAEVHARYEAEAGAILAELDGLGRSPTEEPTVEEARGARDARPWWRHPIRVAIAAVTLLGLGVGLGIGVARHTMRDANAARAAGANAVRQMPGANRGGPQEAGGRAVTPQMIQGMLQAARTSLFAGRYDEAIAAYQAVLNRDPENVDALAHFGLIVGMGGHIDEALKNIDRALARNPNYPPALLYRGQILYEAKKDTAGALQAWTKLVTLLPPGEDKVRVTKMIADAKAGTLPRP